MQTLISRTGLRVLKVFAVVSVVFGVAMAAVAHGCAAARLPLCE
jgi:hypothetical protein